MGKPKAEGTPASSHGHTPQETNPPSNVASSPTDAVYPPPSNPPYQTSNAAYSSPGNPAYPPGNAAYFPATTGAHSVSRAADPPSRNAPDPPSNAAYPPPKGTTIYPPPPMPVAFPPPGQQLPGYASNPGPVPVKFPPEHYPPAPAFQQQASIAAAPSPGYPIQRPPLTPGRVVPQGSSPWTTELFDCMDDPQNGNSSPVLHMQKSSFILCKRELTRSSSLWKTPDSCHDALDAMRHLRTNLRDHRRRPFEYVKKCQSHRFLPRR